MRRCHEPAPCDAICRFSPRMVNIDLWRSRQTGCAGYAAALWAAASNGIIQKGGRRVVALHPICHRTLHAHFPNAELARIGEDRAALLAGEPVARFVAWIADKRPDFHAPTGKRAGNR